MPRPQAPPVQVARWRAGDWRDDRDQVAAEEPLQLSLDGKPLSIVMRTPGNDLELALGLLWAEQVIRSLDDVARVRISAEAQENEPRVAVANDLVESNQVDVYLRGSAGRRPERAFLATSACGVCGATTVDSLALDFAPLAAGPPVGPAMLPRLPDRLRVQQRLFGSTAGLHAAGLSAERGDPQPLRDAIGRREARGRPEPLAAAPEAVASVTARAIPGPAGPMPVRIYRPKDAVRGVLVYFHGGGWVVGSLEGADGACRALANRSRCVVISIGYRLAPETKFPGAVDDAYAATRWVFEHAVELRIDPARIAVGGSSAGGNLAAAAALVARDRGGPRIACPLLTVPATELSSNAASHREFAEGYGLTSADMTWYGTHYVRSAADADDPYASVLRADLHDMPPAFVITAECDPLRDDGEEYAKRLAELGIAA